MTHYFYGCDEREGSWERYAERCNLFEASSIARQGAPPTIKTLNTWRVESPRGFCFVLHGTEQLLKGLKAASRAEADDLTDAIKQGWEETLERAEALAAKAILIETPSEFSPNQSNRALMTRFGELADEIKPALIWEGHGLWDPWTMRGWANERGLVWAHDPFMAMREGLQAQRGDGCFIINERAGMRRKFDQYDMEDLMDWSQSYQRVFALMRGRYKWDHARELRYVLEYENI